MYNARPYFSLKNVGKKCALYMAKYGHLRNVQSHNLLQGISELFHNIDMFEKMFIKFLSFIKSRRIAGYFTHHWSFVGALKRDQTGEGPWGWSSGALRLKICCCAEDQSVRSP